MPSLWEHIKTSHEQKKIWQHQLWGNQAMAHNTEVLVWIVEESQEEAEGSSFDSHYRSSIT